MKIKDDLLDVLEGMLVRLKDMNPLKSNKNIDYNVDPWNHTINFYLNGIYIKDDDIYEIIYTIQHIYNFLDNYGFDVKILVINEDMDKSIDAKVYKKIDISEVEKDLLSKKYQRYRIGTDRTRVINGSIIIIFEETNKCYNHIYPKGSKMLDKIGGYNSTWNKTFKSVGEVGNFNESKSDVVQKWKQSFSQENVSDEIITNKLTPTQVKFFEIKDIIEDLYGMLVELDDEQIYYTIEPKNEIQLRTMTLLDNFRNIDFSVLIGHRLNRNLEHINLIYDRIESIVSYMKIKGYDTTIKMKTLLKMRSDNLKFDENFERFFYKYFENTDYVLLKFTPSAEVNESLPRQQSVDQLKRVMKQSTKTDIGNRISDMNKQGANIDYIRNPIDSGIESYEDFEKHNKKFVPSWNLKHLLSPFSSKNKDKKK